jgi:hypothetical protein
MPYGYGDGVSTTHWLVGNEVMDIVATLPPSNGEATAKVGDEHADKRINGKNLGDG